LRSPSFLFFFFFASVWPICSPLLAPLASSCPLCWLLFAAVCPVIRSTHRKKPIRATNQQLALKNNRLTVRACRFDIQYVIAASHSLNMIFPSLFASTSLISVVCQRPRQVPGCAPVAWGCLRIFRPIVPLPFWQWDEATTSLLLAHAEHWSHCEASPIIHKIKRLNCFGRKEITLFQFPEKERKTQRSNERREEKHRRTHRDTEDRGRRQGSAGSQRDSQYAAEQPLNGTTPAVQRTEAQHSGAVSAPPFRLCTNGPYASQNHRGLSQTPSDELVPRAPSPRCGPRPGWELLVSSVAVFFFFFEHRHFRLYCSAANVACWLLG
jgi:hypothetical protein